MEFHGFSVNIPRLMSLFCFFFRPNSGGSKRNPHGHHGSHLLFPPKVCCWNPECLKNGHLPFFVLDFLRIYIYIFMYTYMYTTYIYIYIYIHIPIKSPHSPYRFPIKLIDSKTILSHRIPIMSMIFPAGGWLPGYVPGARGCVEASGERREVPGGFSMTSPNHGFKCF